MSVDQGKPLLAKPAHEVGAIPSKNVGGVGEVHERKGKPIGEHAPPGKHLSLITHVPLELLEHERLRIGEKIGTKKRDARPSLMGGGSRMRE